MDFKLAELRKRRGITQKELAETLLVSPQTISKWENGMTCPDLEMLVRLTEYFGVTTDMLLGIARWISVMKPLTQINGNIGQNRFYICKGVKRIDGMRITCNFLFRMYGKFMNL